MQNVPASRDAPDFAAWEAAFLTAQKSFAPSNLGQAVDRVELNEEFESLVMVRTPQRVRGGSAGVHR